MRPKILKSGNFKLLLSRLFVSYHFFPRYKTLDIPLYVKAARILSLTALSVQLECRTKKTTKQLYEQVDGVWTEAEATAKKV